MRVKEEDKRSVKRKNRRKIVQEKALYFQERQGNAADDKSTQKRNET